MQFPPWEPGAPHTDGVKSWGDYCPPYFFLFFSHQCETGGENGLLDTAGLLDYMAEDPELAPTLELLRTVPIDPTPFLDAVRRRYPYILPCVLTCTLHLCVYSPPSAAVRCVLLQDFTEPELEFIGPVIQVCNHNV